MARKNYAPPAGFTEMVSAPPVAPPVVQEAPAAPAAPVVAAPEALPEVDLPTMAAAPPEGFTEAMPGEPEAASEELTVDVTGGRLPQKGEEGYEQYIAEGYTDDGTGLKPPEVGVVGGAFAGLKSGATMGFDDEISGVGAGVGSMITGGSFSEGYDAEVETARRSKNNAFDQQPMAYGAGFLPGALLTAPIALGRAVQGANAMANAGRLAATGAVQGGISGTGNADGGLMDRLYGGAVGAGVGAVAAPLVAPVTRVVGSLASRIGETTGASQFARNRLNSGLDVLGRRAPQDANAMATRAAELRSGGVEPSLADVVDESGRGVIRANVARGGPARQEAADAADRVYADAQDRVSDAARRGIGNERLTSRQIARDLASERNQIMGPAMDPIRNTPVPITPELADVLRTPEGQRALSVARGYLLPNERAQINDVLKAVREGTIGAQYSREAQTLIDQIPPSIGAQARQRIIDQIVAQSPPPPTADLTVDIADKFARALGKRAQGNDNGLGRVSSDMSNAVRGAARAASPEYGQALDDYAARSRVADAASGEGRFAEGTDFLRSRTDEFADTVSTAERTAPTVSGGNAPPSEFDAIRTRARDDVVDAASKSPANAYSTAKNLSIGSAQGRRSRTLLGDQGAEALEGSMRSEATRFRNTAYIDERTGSKTAGLIGDQLNNEIVNLIPNAMTGGKWAIVQGVTKFLRRENVRGIDAERLTRDAISRDPARVDEAIEYLVRRGMRNDSARTLVRSIGANMIGRASGAAQSPE